MLLPRNEPVFDGLRTSFLRFDGLLSELRNDALCGFVSVEFAEYSGAILVDFGEAISATEVAGGVETHGAAALKSIVARACEPGGMVGVFRLSSGFVQLAATVGTGSPVYRDLSSTFTSIERLVSKLREDQFDGYIEATYSAPADHGLIFMRAGDVSEAVFERESDIETGSEAVERIIAEANEREATYDVYHTGVPARITTRLSDEAPRQPGPAGASPASVKPAAIPASGPLAIWSEILRRAEDVVDGLSQKGVFATALQEAFKERAKAYPYLDPTVAQFAYREGVATFHGEPVPDSLPDALANSLQDAIARLAFRLKRSDIESRVRAELSEVRSRHSAALLGFPASARALVS